MAVGTTLALQGLAFFVQPTEAEAREWILGFLAFVGAVSFLLGLFTPVGAAITILGGMAAAFSLIRLPQWNLLEAKLTLIYLIAIAAGLFLLGPGAFSIDARIFGRREIVIPKEPS